MLWLVLAPSKPRSTFSTYAPLAFGSFENYGVAWANLMSFQDGIVLRWAWNSVWYTAAIVVIATASAVAAGYALAATAIPFRRTLVTITLIMMLVPSVALVLPLFLQATALGLYNSPWSVILISALNPFGVFLAYIHFSTAVPRELYEAARLDGATEMGLFARIAVPLSRGISAMIAFFAFTAAWVNYFLPYVLLGRGESYPLPVGLGVLFSATPALTPAAGTNTLPIGRPEIALAGLVVALPILFVFLASSRLLTRGAFAGAVKS
ncbi:carbohydrate ABC transporter permease [Microbacterium sp. SLBN-154]|uniref:carbohydrate ABC transporter permease n=1 Tax=Microbacterium sp. SLBN-154 TaxID=2768458 RepID=UPI00115173E3|nr:carbohydrate ABC transporter permease [Microbacterium sp. SLBN-154]